MSFITCTQCCIPDIEPPHITIDNIALHTLNSTSTPSDCAALFFSLKSSSDAGHTKWDVCRNSTRAWYKNRYWSYNKHEHILSSSTLNEHILSSSTLNAFNAQCSSRITGYYVTSAWHPTLTELFKHIILFNFSNWKFKQNSQGLYMNKKSCLLSAIDYKITHIYLATSTQNSTTLWKFKNFLEK